MRNRGAARPSRFGTARLPSPATLLPVTSIQPVVRVCAAIVRDGAILMVRHEHEGEAYWTLPGGGVEPGETPEQAIVREVLEEVCVVGRCGERLCEVAANERGVEVCFAVEIDAAAQPRLGCDPELANDAQILTEIAWRPLAEVADDIQVARVLSASARQHREPTSST